MYQLTLELKKMTRMWEGDQRNQVKMMLVFQARAVTDFQLTRRG